MTLYDYSTSYVQNPFIMPTYYTPTFNTLSFSVPSYGGYPSIFSNMPQTPIINTFDCGTFGYTPTVDSCYIGQGAINPPYNVFPFPINTMPWTFSVPSYTSGYSFGSLTGGYGNYGNNVDFYSSSFGDFGSLLTGRSGYTNPILQSNQNKKYSGKNPTISRALELAVAELGTSEVNGSNDSKEIRKYKNGAKNNLPWCGSFVSWLYGAGQDSNNSKTFGYSMQSQTIRRRAQKEGFYAKKDSGYTPKPGDLMVMKYSDNSGHIGIITKVNSDGSFETIEGNSSNKVRRVHRSMNTGKLDGFVRMDDWLKAA